MVTPAAVSSQGPPLDRRTAEHGLTFCLRSSLAAPDAGTSGPNIHARIRAKTQPDWDHA